MSFPSAQRYLNSFINFENQLNSVNPAQLNLRRVAVLLESLGSPQCKLRSLHLAGTNGKGSVCAFVSSILQTAGYSVGLYTSPHLENIRERIRILNPASRKRQGKIADTRISEKDFCQTLKEIKPHIERIRRRKELGQLTFFEIYTVLALYYFQQKKVDWVVLETGLGGRLDATNLVEARVCGITPISLEHTRQLGDTLERIAYEKAGIIKTHDQKVVMAPQPLQARQVIESRCRLLGIQPAVAGRDIRYQIISQSARGLKFSIITPQGKHQNLHSALLGEHQAVNAAVAVGMITSLSVREIDIGAKDIREGIRRTVWPGRFEIIQKTPFIVLDGAHNPAAMRVLAKTLRDIFPGRKIVLVLGLSGDKNKEGIAKVLRPVAQEIILTKANHPRAAVLNKEEWAKFFPGKHIMYSENVAQAMQQAKHIAKKNSVILVTGSLFVVGEARTVVILGIY